MSTTTLTHEQVERRIAEALEAFGAPPDAIDAAATFEELDVDSLDLVELVQIVEEEYGVRLQGKELPGLRTVGDAVALVLARARS